MTDIYGTRKQFASTNIAEIFALRNVHSQHDLTTPQSTSKDRLLSTGASSRCIPRGLSVQASPTTTLELPDRARSRGSACFVGPPCNVQVFLYLRKPISLSLS